MVENRKFLNRLRNSHLEKSAVTGFFVPDVHPRLRKRLARCTLDCGSKTSESPALRGFVGGLRALATAALYLVLLSNGLSYPKIRLKKFGFLPKPIPANIAKKLPPQRCFKSLFSAFFNFSHKWLTFAFVGESGYTRHPSPEPRTQRLTRRNMGVSDGGGIITLDTSCTFTNIPGPGVRTANFAAFGSWSEALPKNAESLRDSDALMRVAVPKASRPRWAA